MVFLSVVEVGIGRHGTLLGTSFSSRENGGAPQSGGDAEARQNPELQNKP